jgi:hypothetical protein
MTPRKRRREQREEPALPFDVTQEIDASLVEELRRTGEPTLAQDEFEDIALMLPEAPKQR